MVTEFVFHLKATRMQATRILFRQMKMQIETIQNGNVAAATSTTTATTSRDERINRIYFCYYSKKKFHHFVTIFHCMNDVSILFRHLIVGNFAISKTRGCFFLLCSLCTVFMTYGSGLFHHIVNNLVANACNTIQRKYLFHGDPCHWNCFAYITNKFTTVICLRCFAFATGLDFDNGIYVCTRNSENDMVQRRLRNVLRDRGFIQNFNHEF